jgi:hypothetical protein
MFFTTRLCGFLLILLLPQLASALDKAFWLPADAEVQLIPQAAPDSITYQPGVEPEAGFSQYPDTPPPKVPPRKDKLTFYPCSQCHANWQTNEEPRALAPVHEVSLKHGDGRLWCLTCHDPKNRDKLHTVRDGEVDFDEAWKVCGQCHSNRQKDWYYGAHGKRVYDWKGEPTRYNCTHCHNPHRPPFMQRKPQPKPPVRAGLEPMKHEGEHHRLTVWERHASQEEQEKSHD